MQQDLSATTPTSATAPPVPSPSAVPEKTDAKSTHFKSAGEKKFDFFTYNVIGYMANVLLSVGAVFWVERTPSGQKFMDGLVKLAKKIPGVDEGWAKTIASKSFFLTGGFAVMAPMKRLEDHKAEWVKQANQRIYGAQAETDPQLVQSQKELEAAPKQTWASLFGSRLLSLIPFYITTGVLWDRMSPLSKATNPELRALSSETMAGMEASEVSRIASKGFYVDRLIVAPSRWIGKTIAGVLGHHDAATQITEVSARHPGTMRAPDFLHHSVSSSRHDPVHSALPYYFISETITSALVARGVFLLSRILAPIFDRKPHAATPAKSAAPPLAATADEKPAATDGPSQPGARISKEGLEHEAPTTTALSAARA